MSFLRSRITQLFISIIVDKNQILLLARTYKKGEVIDSYERSFEDTKRVNHYIQELTMEFQVFYVSLFVTTLGQGLLPIADAKQCSKYSIDYYSITPIPLGEYLIYINTKELEKITANFSKIVYLSTLYSPFALLDFLIKDKKIIKNTLCVYKYSSYLAVAVYNGQLAKFGAFFHILLEEEASLQSDDFEEISEPVEEVAELENDSLEKLEVKSLDEAIEDTPDLLEELGLDENNDDDSDLKDFAQYMKMCEYIVDAVKEYYENELYDSEFIEDILLCSEAKLPKTATQFLENELFIKPRQELVSTLSLMQSIMIGELA